MQDELGRTIIFTDVEFYIENNGDLAVLFVDAPAAGFPGYWCKALINGQFTAAHLEGFRAAHQKIEPTEAQRLEVEAFMALNAYQYKQSAVATA
jgi:hypothetical protein